MNWCVSTWEVKIARDGGGYDLILEGCPGHIADLMYRKLSKKGEPVIIGITGTKPLGRWFSTYWGDHKKEIEEVLE